MRGLEYQAYFGPLGLQQRTLIVGRSKDIFSLKTSTLVRLK